MKVLGIESATIVASCALIDDDKLIGEYTQSHKKTHSEKLMPLIIKQLEDTETALDDIDTIAISKGPGSYTGLRIGAAIGKGLGQACNKPIVGVPTIAALAYNACALTGYIVPILDARGGRVYTGIYKWQSNLFHTIKEQWATEIEALIENLEALDEPILFNGDGASLHKQALIEKLGKKAQFISAYNNMPKASSVAQLGYEMAKKGHTISPYDFAPEYLRKSQAERNLNKR